MNKNKYKTTQIKSIFEQISKVPLEETSGFLSLNDLYAEINDQFVSFLHFNRICH